MAKHNLPVITAEEYNLSPDRYELRKGSATDAPLCPFGNHFEWIGFGKENKSYVRFTKKSSLLNYKILKVFLTDDR